MYCANRAVLVPVLGMRLHMHCANRAALEAALGPGLQMQMHCASAVHVQMMDIY